LYEGERTSRSWASRASQHGDIANLGPAMKRAVCVVDGSTGNHRTGGGKRPLLRRNVGQGGSGRHGASRKHRNSSPRWRLRRPLRAGTARVWQRHNHLMARRTQWHDFSFSLRRKAAGAQENRRDESRERAQYCRQFICLADRNISGSMGKETLANCRTSVAAIVRRLSTFPFIIYLVIRHSVFRSQTRAL